MYTFAMVLEDHRARFVKARALLVEDDKTLRRYVLSWSPMLVRRRSEWPSDETMAALWDCVEVDHQALADLTGDSSPDVMAALRRLQGLELIYPDGTLPRAVIDLLRSRLEHRLGSDDD